MMYKNGKKPNFKIVNRYYKEYVDANNRQFNTIYKPANTLRKSKERNVLLEQKKIGNKGDFSHSFLLLYSICSYLYFLPGAPPCTGLVPYRYMSPSPRAGHATTLPRQCGAMI